jgi:glycosyltransferase involved in cell wall biosynthesis
MLTIAIPTYNRNERLNRSLRVLLPQISAHSSFCRLVFLDNCSPTPITETLPVVMNEFPQVQYEVVRNKQNIGANANIMRCFEMCETEWIWCLSDDDPVADNALAIVRQHVEEYSDCVYINFPYDNLRPRTYLTTGIDEFVDKLDYSSNLPWIASSIHRAANMQANIKYGYQFAYSMLPHVATLLISLGQQGKCCMSNAQIMGVNDDSTPFEEQWSIVTFALGSPVIYDLPFSFSTRKKLANKLLVTSHGESVRLRVVVVQLLLAYFQGNEHTERFDKGNLLFHYDQAVSRNYYLYRRFGKRGLLIAYYRLMVRYPDLTGKVLRLFQKKLPGLLGRQDRYVRLVEFLRLPRLDTVGRQSRYERV